MYKAKFLKPIKNTNDVYNVVKQAYINESIPIPYPAANKHLQPRLTQFVSNGLSEEQSMSLFDKVNSNRIYSLEKHNDLVQLMMIVKEKDETKKLIVLSIDEETRIIVSSFIRVLEETGFIESAPKYHNRLHKIYAISNKRIRLVQRTFKTNTSTSVNDENEDFESEHAASKDLGNDGATNQDIENKDKKRADINNEDLANNGDEQRKSILKTHQIRADTNSSSSSCHMSIKTRPAAKLIKSQNIKSIKRANSISQPDEAPSQFTMKLRRR